MNKVLVFAILLTCCLTEKPWKFKDCVYSTQNKSIGHFSQSTGRVEGESFKNITVSLVEQCNEVCRLNDECFCTEYRGKMQECRLFSENISFIEDPYFYTVSQWIKCDLSEGYQPEHGKCEGNFVAYYNESFSIINFDSLLVNEFEKIDCLRRCLENKFCGYVNIGNNSTCSIIQKWPTSKLIRTNDSTTIGYAWTCIDHYEDRIPVETTVYYPPIPKCKGLWKLVNRNESHVPHERLTIVVSFQSHTDCLKECDYYSNCTEVWYNYDECMCKFSNESISSTETKQSTLRYLHFEWQCRGQDSRYEQPTEKEQRFMKNQLRCARLVNTKRAFIAFYDFYKPMPNETSFQKCDESESHNSEWTIKDSCLKNQQFWTFPSLSKHFRYSIQNVTLVTRIFTGLTSYWIAHGESDILPINFTECRKFDASRFSSQINDIYIYRRSDWQAASQRGTIPEFLETPKYVVISETITSSCRSLLLCLGIIRTIQASIFRRHFSDIPFNFLVDEMGRIYTGRGWHLVGEVVKQYNEVTISIAYLGRCEEKFPSAKFAESTKRLIEYGVQRGYIQSNYTLFLLQDLTTSSVNTNLSLVIKNWYRYRNHVPEEYVLFNNSIIYLNIASVVVSFIFILAYRLFGFKRACRQCKFLGEESEKYQMIFPGILSASQNSMLMDTWLHNYVIISEKTYCFTSNSKRYIYGRTLINTFLLYKYIKRNDECLTDGDIQTFLQSEEQLQTNFYLYKACVNDLNASHSQLQILLCASNTNTFEFLKELIKRRKCVCRFFQFHNFYFGKWTIPY